jgi:hypothetical protein
MCRVQMPLLVDGPESGDVMSRVPENLIGMADLQSVLGGSAGLRVEDIMAEVEAMQAARRAERSLTITSKWHNRTLGKVVFGVALMSSLVLVLVAHGIVNLCVFEMAAKVGIIIAGIVGSIALLFEEPFHEDVGDEVSRWCRVRVQGKVIGLATLIAGFATVLTLRDEQEQRAAAERKVVVEIKKSAGLTIEQLDQVQGQTRLLLDRIDGADRKFKELGGALDDLRRKSDSLGGKLDGSVLGMLAGLRTDTAFLKTAVTATAKSADLADLAKRADVADLAKRADLTELARTADLADLAKRTDVADLVRRADLADLAKRADLTELARTADLADLAKTTELADLAKSAELADLARTTELADLAKTTELAQLAKVTDVANLAKVSDLADLAKTANLTDLAKASDLTNLAKTTDVVSRCGAK